MAFARIHATTVTLKRRLQTVQNTQTIQTMQTAFISQENLDCYSSRDTDKFTHDLSANWLRNWYGQSFLLAMNLSSLLLRFKNLIS